MIRQAPEPAPTETASEEWRPEWLVSPAIATSRVVDAWARRDPLEAPISLYYTVRTDGWSILLNHECLVSRLQFTDCVGVSARRFRGLTADVLAELRGALMQRRVPLVALEPPYPVTFMERVEFDRAWEIARTGDHSADYLVAARAIVEAWRADQIRTVDVCYLEISTHGGAIWALGDCVAVHAPSPRRLVLVSMKRYRPGGASLERHRGAARDAVRAAIVESGLLARDVKPAAAAHEEIRPRHLLDAWSSTAPHLEALPPDPAAR